MGERIQYLKMLSETAGSIKMLIIGYLVRLFPAIIGLIGAIIDSSILFAIGGGLCVAIHVGLFFRGTFMPLGRILLIYLFCSFILFNDYYQGFIWGSLLATFFEMLYNVYKTFKSINYFAKQPDPDKTKEKFLL